MTAYPQASVFGTFIYIGSQYRYYQLSACVHQDENLLKLFHFSTEHNFLSELASLLLRCVLIMIHTADVLTSLHCYVCEDSSTFYTTVSYRLLLTAVWFTHSVLSVPFYFGSVLGNGSYFIYFFVFHLLDGKLQKGRDTTSAIVCYVPVLRA